MSDKKLHHFGCGVIKFDYKHAGYPDVMRIARELASDPGFKELLVRSVSQTNFGIQFTYLSKSEAELEVHPVKQITDDLKQEWGTKTIYAWDFMFDSFTSEQEAMEFIVVSNPIN